MSLVELHLSLQVLLTAWLGILDWLLVLVFGCDAANLAWRVLFRLIFPLLRLEPLLLKHAIQIMTVCDLLVFSFIDAAVCLLVQQCLTFPLGHTTILLVHESLQFFDVFVFFSFLVIINHAQGLHLRV